MRTCRKAKKVKNEPKCNQNICTRSKLVEIAFQERLKAYSSVIEAASAFNNVVNKLLKEVDEGLEYGFERDHKDKLKDKIIVTDAAVVEKSNYLMEELSTKSKEFSLMFNKNRMYLTPKMDELLAEFEGIVAFSFESNAVLSARQIASIIESIGSKQSLIVDTTTEMQKYVGLRH